MSRSVFQIGLVAAVAVAAGIVFRETLPARFAVAQAPRQARQQASGDAARPAAVPLADVVMYTAGVGYFEHQAELAGDGSLDLRVEREEIDDLLKSLIVQDFGGGNIQMVNYGSHAPAKHALQSFSLDLATNPSLADLLQQARGAVVTVNAPNETSGRIISVEKQQRPAENDDEQPMTVHVLNLLVDEAVKPISLNLVQSIEFEDQQLNADLRQALDVLARSHNADQKTLHLAFSGDKKRFVRVGYVRPMPVWKMTYRLALQDDQSHVLQGWAIVENTTEQDWRGINLTLVSGQPVTFEMPLYQPLFVDRPTVELDLYDSLKPQAYAQDLNQQRVATAASQADKSADALAKAEKAKAGGEAFRRNARQLGAAALADRGTASARKALDLRQGAQAVAEAGEMGELVQYEVRSPVTLSRQQSALIPVVNAQVEGERFSIYDQSVFDKHPLYGIRMKNTSKLHLMEGPITVFDDGRFAGDAIIEGLSPAGERLISYGIDLDVEVAPETDAHARSLRQVRIMNGTLYAKYEQLQEKTYRVKNSSDQDKQVLVVVPQEPNWDLLRPEAEDSTRDDYRFLVSPAANETVVLAVELRRTISEQVVLTNLNDETIGYYVRSDSISDEAKQALSEVADRKREIQQLQRQHEELKAEVGQISTQQQRIRQNMEQLDRNTDLYARYVTKLGNQEDRIERLQSEIDSLEQTLEAKRRALNAYLDDLSIP